MTNKSNKNIPNEAMFDQSPEEVMERVLRTQKASVTSTPNSLSDSNFEQKMRSAISNFKKAQNTADDQAAGVEVKYRPSK